MGRKGHAFMAHVPKCTIFNVSFPSWCNVNGVLTLTPFHKRLYATALSHWEYNALEKILCIPTIWLWLYMQLVFKSTTFTTIVRLVLCAILVVNVYSHMCNYYSHLCDHSVDITKWMNINTIIVCLNGKVKGKCTFFIWFIKWILGWMNIAFTTSHSYFGN
jgi:hypothetical protein